MTGRALVKQAFQLRKAERIPWVPFVGVHGARLIGATATAYLQSADLLFQGVSKAIELYQPDGIPVVFDLQMEAEILGCKLAWSDHNPPAVVSHPLLEGKTLADMQIPDKNAGRIKLTLEATRRLRNAHPDVALYGLITGPFTLALHLLGTDIFMKMLEDPDSMTALLQFTNEVGKHMASYYIEAGCDIVAVVDPMTSQIDPMSFETFVTPCATGLFEHIRQQGALSSFFVCGHAQQNIEAMCGCKPDNISIDENIPLDYVKEVALKNDLSFGGNIKLTVVMLMGTPNDVQENALECMDMGGNKGFILAPGCDMPMDTPIENVKAVTGLVHDPYRQEVVRAMEKEQSKLDLLNLKDYGQTDRVVVDVITLDSESCAPCQYMVEAVKKVTPHFEGLVEWREHAIKKLEAVTFMSSLMVKNIPTICIDGKIAFVSQIPPRQELIAAIQKRINEKLKLKLKSKKGELFIFGKTAEECQDLIANVKRATAELGQQMEIKMITDPHQLAIFGITETPAAILAEYKVKSTGTNPSVEIIKEWVKNVY
ncbi:MAG: uroporphyrinogen decarboxylase [Cyclobacteriaceae bacterium]|nr:uroporphyrinogen decarboxylase [Cyclobacteriaceae bacterium]